MFSPTTQGYWPPSSPYWPQYDTSAPKTPREAGKNELRLDVVIRNADSGKCRLLQNAFFSNFTPDEADR
jgi:hypothetical protein